MRTSIKAALAALLLSATTSQGFANERIILLNEGLWQSDNGRISYFEDGHIVSNQWFMDVNGNKLGDTPNDIIRVNDNPIAIAVNWSNIVQFITPAEWQWLQPKISPIAANSPRTAITYTYRPTVTNVASTAASRPSRRAMWQKSMSILSRLWQP